MVSLFDCGTTWPFAILRGVIGKEFAKVLDRARSGDAAAFACLWYDIHPTLRSYLEVIAGVVHEDVVTATWIAVERGVKDFRGDEMAWRSWVFATARRAEPAALDHDPLRVRESAGR